MNRSRSSAKLPSLAGLAPPGWLSLSIKPSSSYAYDSSWDDEPSGAAVVAGGVISTSQPQPVPAPGFFVPFLAASIAAAKSDVVASQTSGSGSGVVVGAESAEVKEEVPVMPAPPEPAWVRAEYFPSNGIPVWRPLCFVGKKTIQESDLSVHQCRFLMPRGDSYRLLRPLLSHEERVLADLVDVSPRPPEERVVGKKYDGLSVYVVVNRWHRLESKLCRWFSGNIVLKFGTSYRSFVEASGLRMKDNVHLWAFRRDGEGDTLQLVIDKTDGGGMPSQPLPLPALLPHADVLAAVKVEDDQA